MLDYIKELEKKKLIQQIPEEFNKFMKVVAKHKPKTILEIGVAKGGTSMCFSKVCERLVSVDIVDFEPLDNQTFIRRNSHDPATIAKVAKALDGHVVDLLFIDGEHSYNGVKQDYEMYSPLVRSGGLIAFHDIAKSEYHDIKNCLVYKLWQELKTNTSIEIQVDKVKCGIGVLIQD